MTTISVLPIDSVHARIGNAEEYLDTLKNQIKSWMDKNPYSVAIKTNSDFTRYSFILKIDRKPPLQKWSLMASDILHNLRCALDYLVYAIAVYESGKEVPPNNTSLMFPICDTSTHFWEQDRRRLKTLSQPVRSTIEALQPYNSSNKESISLFSVLRDFDDFNKHRLLKVAVSAVRRRQIGGEFPAAYITKNPRVVINKRELKDGADIASFVFDSPAPDVEFDKTHFEIILACFSETKTNGNTNSRDIEITHLLELLIKETKSSVGLVLKSVYSCTGVY